MLRCDLYSSRHTQWFYFRVAGMESGAAYTFSIINLLKTDSLYNHGIGRGRGGGCSSFGVCMLCKTN